MAAEAHVDFAVLLQIIQFITSVVLAPVAIALIRRLSAIRDHLSRINGNVVELRQWRADHEQLADRERLHHEETRRQCRENTAVKIRHVEESLDQVWGRIGDRRRYPQDRTD